MTEQALQKLKYPVGKFVVPEHFSTETRAKATAAIKQLPGKIRQATYGLTEQQLDLPYRDGGWSIRQITHHLADSHINSFVRFKLSLTEDNPTIKPYDQDLWASGTDAKLPISASLSILDGLHERLTNLLEKMSPVDYARTLYHPELEKELPLDYMASMYGWHSNHHLQQIINLKSRQGW